MQPTRRFATAVAVVMLFSLAGCIVEPLGEGGRNRHDDQDHHSDRHDRERGDHGGDRHD